MDAVVADLAHDAAGVLEEAQVGERLAEREAELVGIELAAEQDGDDLGGAPRLDERIHRLAEPRRVVVTELAQAGVKTTERQAVRRQDERARGQLGKTVERGEKAA